MDNAVIWTDVALVGIAALQFVVLIVAAFVAWRQVREARRLREEQQRPFVVIDFEVERGYIAFLVVSNLGTSLARDVRFSIDPPLESAVPSVALDKMKMLNQGISTLAPGKKIRTFFDMGDRRGKTDLPMTYTARVQYTDETGRRLFDETVDLDLDLYMHLSEITRQGVHDIHKRLEEIRDVFKKWSWNLPGGLIAMTPEEARRESDRIVAEMEEREREGEATSDY